MAECVSVTLHLIMLILGVYQDDWPAMALAQLGKFCITFAFGALFVYSAELVPTVIRTGTIGSASFIGKYI